MVPFVAIALMLLQLRGGGYFGTRHGWTARTGGALGLLGLAVLVLAALGLAGNLPWLR